MISTTIKRLFIILLIALPALQVSGDQRQLAPEDPFMAKVVGVSERNSLVILTDAGRYRQITLAHITLPVGDQPYAKRAHEILRHQLSGRRVSVRPIAPFSGEYTQAVFYIKTHNFNIDLVYRGHAWVDFYHRNTAAYLNAQRSAVANKRGLYADPHAKHPVAWMTQQARAEEVVGEMNRIANDPDLDRVLNETYIGHRSRKVFVPTRCTETWADWKWTERSVVTTLAGAAADGYTQIECE